MITITDRKTVIQAHAVAHFAEEILAEKERVDHVEMGIATNPDFVFELRCFVSKPHYREHQEHIANEASFMDIIGDGEACIEDFDYEVNDCNPTERQYAWLAISHGCCETNQLGWARDTLYDIVCLQENLATHEWSDILEVLDYTMFQLLVDLVILPTDGHICDHAVLTDSVSDLMAEI